MVQATDHDQWLAETRRFWDVPDEDEARFGRVCSSPEIDAARDPIEREAIWRRETDEAVQQILDGVPLSSEWICLEIGCGVGRLMKALAPRCRRVVGVDLSEPMLEHARRYLAGVGNVDLHLNDGRTMPMVADGSVNFVYSHLAFQHLTRYDVVDQYLSEIVRVLRPSGWCRIQNWREGSLPVGERIKNVGRRLLGREVLRSERCWQWHEGRQVRFGGVTYTPREWRKTLRRAGLVPVDLHAGLGHEYWLWSTSRRPPL